jgi:hypothetical protein
MKKIPLVFLVVALLAGCATPYGKYDSFIGAGYADLILDSRRAVITYRASSDYDDGPDAVMRGAMLRAAELTLDRGFAAFDVSSDGGNTSESMMMMNNTYIAGGQAFSSPMIFSTGESTYRVSITMLNRDEMSSSSYDASEIMENMKAYFPKQ